MFWDFWKSNRVGPNHISVGNDVSWTRGHHQKGPFYGPTRCTFLIDGTFSIVRIAIFCHFCFNIQQVITSNPLIQQLFEIVIALKEKTYVLYLNLTPVAEPPQSREQIQPLHNSPALMNHLGMLTEAPPPSFQPSCPAESLGSTFHTTGLSAGLVLPHYVLLPFF